MEEQELMDIEEVQIELRRILADFEVKAVEAGDTEEYYRAERNAEAIVNALEYLWMYQDLME